LIRTRKKRKGKKERKKERKKKKRKKERKKEGKTLLPFNFKRRSFQNIELSPSLLFSLSKEIFFSQLANLQSHKLNKVL
jgi:hypothetical protein